MKLKFILLVVISWFSGSAGYAQNQSMVYYLKDSGALVSAKDSADYWMVVMPPDRAIDKKLYRVYQYYKNGQLMLVTGSRTNDLNLKYQGAYISYYENGHKMKMGDIENGEAAGNETNYYPNGNLYTVIKHFTNVHAIYLQECRDSLGAVLTNEGNGKWVEFDDDFKYITRDGFVAQGNKDSIWTTWQKGRPIKQETYRRRRLVLSDNMDGKGPISYSDIGKTAEFPGGTPALIAFLTEHIRYPAVAKENGTQGKVIVSFIVNTDGTLDDIRVSRGIGDGCDEEAIRAVNLMPKWLPGTMDGKPVRIAYSLPINFGLTEKGK